MKAISLVCLIALFSGVDVGRRDPRAVVESERAFAKLTAQVGVRDGFLAYIADDGVMFRPRAVPGKATLEKSEKRPGLLLWYPTHAGISSSGDLGWTTGPSEFLPNGAGKEPVFYGNFATVWKKQSDGRWKWVADIGTSNEQPSARVAEWSSAGMEPDQVSAGGTRAELVAAEASFAQRLKKFGVGQAYREVLAREGRVHRDDRIPGVGIEDGARAAGDGPTLESWTPEKAEVSAAGDMGYSYGLARLRGGEGVYLRIWQRVPGGKWQVLLDVVKPL